MPIPLSQLDPAVLAGRRPAVFLDFDGTLVDIAERPDMVRLTATARELVRSLHELLGGAVAIISGRPVTEIDGYFGALRLPVAGIHGAERRGGDGRLRTFPSNPAPLEAIRSDLRALQARYPDLTVEDKGAAVAVHYRARPELEDACRQAMMAAAGGHESVTVISGKMVFEARPAQTDKARAIADFLAEPEFAGRHAIFAGDDRTDEDGFSLVNRLGGVSVKVGEGETLARYRAADRAQLMNWLSALADGLRGAGRSSGD